MRETIDGQQGKCPYCGGDNLEYGKVEFYDDQLFFPRTCGDCKAEGEEWYSMEFIEHVINEKPKDSYLNKNETKIDKKELFSYLDGYSFVSSDEVEMAVSEYIENQEGELYYSDLAFAGELAKEYIKLKGFDF